MNVIDYIGVTAAFWVLAAAVWNAGHRIAEAIRETKR